MEFINAVKDRVVGVVEENVGYLTGNHELEQKGRELRDSGKDQAQHFYEDAGNVQNPPSESMSDQKSAVERLRDAHHEVILNQPEENSSTYTASTVMINQMHGDTIPHWESAPVKEQPVIAPIKTENVSPLPAKDQWVNQPSVPLEEKESETKWVDKLGALMSGTNKDEAFWRASDVPEENTKDERSVMDKIRGAHVDAKSSPQQKGMTETIKEKFDNWSHSTDSANRGFPENVQNRLGNMKDSVQESVSEMKESVQEKVGDVKDHVDSMWSGSQNDEPLPVKHVPIADIPDPNFIQNA